MTKERKDKVIENLLDWMSEVVSDDGEYYNALKNSIGLTEREIRISASMSRRKRRKR